MTRCHRRSLSEIAGRAAAWTWQRPAEREWPDLAELHDLIEARHAAQARAEAENWALSKPAIYWSWEVAGEGGDTLTLAEALHDAKAAAWRAYSAGRFNPQHQTGVLFVITERGLSLHSQLIYEPPALADDEGCILTTAALS
jgi:hypothetical protein